MNGNKPLLIYVLHSGNLYGTERMALATVDGLRDEFDPLILAPPGPLLAEAARRGYSTFSFRTPLELTHHLWLLLRGRGEVAFMATGVTHSLAFTLINLIRRRKARHLHVVHGGTDERLSYGRKRRLNRLGVQFAAVSDYVKERLVAHGVPPGRIAVIENFLSREQLAAIPRRRRFIRRGIERAVVVSRVDPIKRVDLLLDALDLQPELDTMEIRVCGGGWQLEELRQRAAKRHRGVEFLGYTDNVGREIADADMLIHLCPEEPFGLALLEAMAAGVPVLAPDSGGAGDLIVDGISGFHFRANDAADLAKRLSELRNADAETLNRVVEGGRSALRTRFSERDRLADYRRLISAHPDIQHS